ncbi:transposase [Trichonephila clavipes]|nr:transposase [Trichonephila clavipes]
MITHFFIPELNSHDVQELWFQQDGATCHTARATIDLLKDTFGDRLISRFGPVNRPPKSCDLTPLDYFLWGYVKSLVYADKPQTLGHLEGNIRRVIADIRPQMLEKVIENWTSRLDYIRASRGSHMPDIIFKIRVGHSTADSDGRRIVGSVKFGVLAIPAEDTTIRIVRSSTVASGVSYKCDFKWPQNKKSKGVQGVWRPTNESTTSNPPPGICIICQVIYSQFGLAIHQNNHQARRRFVEWAQNEIAAVPDFHKRSLFSDEAHFWLNGYVNKQNCRIWSEANPQVYVETPLHPEKLTVWCALWTGAVVPTRRHKMSHSSCQLKDTFGDRLISRFGPVNWPPRSCDLTPLDYFLWGYVKSLVYADKPQTLDHLEYNIRRVIADIRPQMLEKVIENWTSRLDYIRASRGSPMPEIIFKISWQLLVLPTPLAHADNRGEEHLRGAPLQLFDKLKGFERERVLAILKTG